MSYTRVTLQQHPKTTIEPSTFKDETVPIPTKDDLKDGDYLIKVKLVSLDPTLRGQMSGQKSYIEPVKLGDVMRAWGLGEVVESKNPEYKVGDIVSGVVGFSEYAIGHNQDHRKIPNIPGIPLEDNLGVLGLTGLTAWWGINGVAGGIKSGETVLVSGAAGATGSVAGQLAKIAGAKVIGIAGGKDKCDFITKELGFDVALDYKSADFKKDFKEATKGVLTSTTTTSAVRSSTWLSWPPTTLLDSSCAEVSPSTTSTSLSLSTTFCRLFPSESRCRASLSWTTETDSPRSSRILLV